MVDPIEQRQEQLSRQRVQRGCFWHCFAIVTVQRSERGCHQLQRSREVEGSNLATTLWRKARGNEKM